MYLFRNLLKSNSTIISDTDIKEFKFIKNIADKRKIKINSIGFKSGTIKILSNKYTVYLGSISYGVYMIHFGLVWFFRQFCRFIGLILPSLYEIMPFSIFF